MDYPQTKTTIKNKQYLKISLIILFGDLAILFSCRGFSGALIISVHA